MCDRHEQEGNYINWQSAWLAVEKIKNTPPHQSVNFDIDEAGNIIFI